MPTDCSRCARWRLRSAAAHEEPPAVVVAEGRGGRLGEPGCRIIDFIFSLSPDSSSPLSVFFFTRGGGEKREGWVRVEHPGPLGNKGRVHTCLLLNRLLASFTAVFTRRCYKLLSPFISARLEVMNQSVSRNGEKNLSKITYSLRDDNILWKSVIWMYCCFENALKNVSFYFKGVYLRFKPLFWHLDAGNNSGTDLNFHWHTLDMLKVCQEVDGLPGNVGWRRDGANKRALIHTAGLGLTGPVRD